MNQENFLDFADLYVLSCVVSDHNDNRMTFRSLDTRMVFLQYEIAGVLWTKSQENQLIAV